MESRRNDELARLVRDLAHGAITRRHFVRRAAAIGLAAPVAAAVATAYTARMRAQEATQEADEVTVRVDGTVRPVATEDTSSATPGGTLRFARRAVSFSAEAEQAERLPAGAGQALPRRLDLVVAVGV